jgi:hypothetical protein
MFHVRRLILTQSSLSISKYSRTSLKLLEKNINTHNSTKVLAINYTQTSLGSAPEKVASNSSTLIISESCVNVSIHY